ncbi:MAG: hypothetical protein KC493_08250 [Bacteriovoracaceae bacterium]|nr:hypothetical protein [Bacteriovoracaceae bacterium]
MQKKQTTDKHALYLSSVQDPVSDVERISKIYSELFSKSAKSFREDFSGTFALSCCWVQSGDTRTAIAIDIDKETIEYGVNNYLKNLSSKEQSRLKTVVGNAITETSLVDIIGVFNFSYCLIHKREQLLDYFKKCLSSLNEQGMIILDIFGGSDSEILEIQEKDIDHHPAISPFLFQFERKSFNPITRISNYGIHFIYPDGTKLMDSFTYEFRMWTITEIRDLLEEAGFSKSLVYWEDFDDEGFGNGEFYQTEKEENSINWNAYIVGVR